ncbi:MAG TPA: DUF3426 domain-containing protein [Povalibacter sp.]
MLTQCPSCQTTFRITSEILRVAHGQVRCGRCHTQFNALERLIEEEGVADAESGRFLEVPEAEQIEVDEPEAQEDITMEGHHIEITGTYRVITDPEDPQQIRQEVTEEWVQFDDVDAEDSVPDSDMEVIEDIEDREAEAAAAEQDLAAATAAKADQQDRLNRRLAAASAQRRAAEESESASELEQITLKRSRPRTLIWTLLAAPLLLLLIAQIVHHFRSELARHPVTGAPLVRLYATLGLPLMPDWQLHAYEIKQWGVLSDPMHPGTLKVRASVTNRAPFAQPYPLLRLVLEDRWGDQVRAREFEPAEYLDPGTAANRLLAPGQPTNATIAIVDPGPDAEGFRFDVCLRGKAAVPVCAAEVPQ